MKRHLPHAAWRVFLAGCLLLVAAGLLRAASGPTVPVLQWQGIINPASADFINRGIRQAAENQAPLVVIQLDTPGGLDSSMRDIIRTILASPIPVATYVGPSGARAASAGTFILMASHVAAMAPGTNLGAASPVAIGMPGGSSDSADNAETGQEGGPSDDTASEPRDEGGKGADQASEQTPRTGSTLENKARNDAMAYMRSLAEMRGRNVTLAESTVRDATSYTASQALRERAIDIVTPSLDSLLKALDGREIAMEDGRSVKLSLANATLEPAQPDWRTKVLDILANPQLAVVLMMIGIYGLFFELTSPGFAVPGVAGLISLLLALYAFHLLPVNWAGVGLMGLGAILMVAEAFLPSFGVLGIGGIVAFVLGGLFLSDTGLPGYDLTLPFLGGIAAVFAGLVALVGVMFLRSRRRKPTSGAEALAGMTGEVTHIDGSKIHARVNGELWRVVSAQSLSLGDTVQVDSVSGLTLQVRRLEHSPDSVPQTSH